MPEDSKHSAMEHLDPIQQCKAGFAKLTELQPSIMAQLIELEGMLSPYYLPNNYAYGDPINATIGEDDEQRSLKLPKSKLKEDRDIFVQVKKKTLDLQQKLYLYQNILAATPRPDVLPPELIEKEKRLADDYQEITEKAALIEASNAAFGHIFKIQEAQASLTLFGTADKGEKRKDDEASPDEGLRP